jgi:hypothetical protein
MRSRAAQPPSAESCEAGCVPIATTIDSESEVPSLVVVHLEDDSIGSLNLWLWASAAVGFALTIVGIFQMT